MAPKKKSKTPLLPAWLRRSTRWLCGTGRTCTLIMLMTGLLAGGWWAVWCYGGVGRHVLSGEGYVLSADDIEVVPNVPRIDAHVREDAFRNACVDGPPSILDEDLTERIRNAFSMEPWVAKVVRVTKHHPPCVRVEVVYRRPVCVVEVGDDLHLVDVHGVQLPAMDYSPTEIGRFPRLRGIDTRPLGIVGEYWGDPRIVGGAEIAEALEKEWDHLQLSHITPAPNPAGSAIDEHNYVLFTLRGSRVHWGRPPGSDAPGELSTAEKIARLKRYVAKYGTLDGARGAPQELDMYQLQR